MKITQTITHDDPARPGNCFAAAVATAIDRPLSEVPHFVEWGQHLHNGQSKVSDFEDADADRKCWWAMFLGYVAACGLWPEPIASLDDAKPGEIVFVNGPSPRGIAHQVLYRDGELWHDPHPSGDGLASIDPEGMFVLRPATHDHQPTSEGPMREHRKSIKEAADERR